MLTLILQLVSAHIAGDFLLQPGRWVIGKKALKIRSKFLYAHLAVHLGLMLLTTRFAPALLPAVLLIAVTHYLIDLAKLYLDDGKPIWFVLDQLLHLAVIALVVNHFYPFTIDWELILGGGALLLYTALIAATYGTSVLLKIILAQWNVHVAASGSSNQAGKYIGMLERLFVFGFVVMGFWEGIGFLLAAKSIFRFGDLKEAHDIKLTEYILIGTLLSFGIGIAIALGYREVWGLLG